MTYKELIYMCLDEIKLASDDSYITEDHILFLISKYRAFLLKQKYEKTNMPVARSNYQKLVGITTDSTIPSIMGIATPIVKFNVNSTQYSYVSPHRFQFVGNNKYTSSISYCTIDNGILKTTERKQEQKRGVVVGPSPAYFSIYAVFEDIQKASELDGSSVDILDKVCPIETDLVPGIQELVVKDILGIAYRPQDKANNGSDELGSVGLMSGNSKNK